MEPKEPPQWMARLDERTNKHIVYARSYAREFAHGAPGHLDLMTIAQLAQLLDDAEQREGEMVSATIESTDDGPIIPLE